MFKRMMVLGAMASALAFAGCQNRTQSGADVGAEGTGGAGTESQVPATGGSGRTDTIPGSTDTLGGTEQDADGIDLGGTGAGDMNDTGGSGLQNDQGADSLNQGGTGGAGTSGQGGSLDHSGSDMVHEEGSLNEGGTGGSGPEDDHMGTGNQNTGSQTGTMGGSDDAGSR
jgi:hypothetical protein